MGIVLVTTLLIICFMLMFAAGIVVTTRRQASMTNQFYHRETALFAAQTGINYAMMRLSNNPYWMGCTYNTGGSGSDYTLIMDNGKKIDIREHAISGNMGVVEGKIDDGEAGYFDLYFVAPDVAKDRMDFFGIQGSGKILLPSKIALCNNRNNQLTDPPLEPGETVPGSWAKYSDNTYYKPTPQNSVLLVCRGVMGREQRTVEVCVRLGAGEDFNSVAIGRGDVEINLEGDGKLFLSSVNADKPPFIRTKGSIKVGNGSTSYNDYLVVNGGGGGRASGNILFSPKPSNYANTFQGGVNISDSAYPPLQWSHVIPKMDTFGKINAGYYKIIPDKTPRIEYYPSNDLRKIANGEITPITDGSDSLSALLKDGTLVWNDKKNIIGVNKSIQVNGVTVNGELLKDLQVVSSVGEYISFDLNSVINPKKGKTNNVYLVNNNDGGSIKIDGGLTGIGTVITKGNLEIQAESQLSAIEETGISIYAMGDIIINPITVLPKKIDGTEELSSADKDFLNTVSDKIKNKNDSRYETFRATDNPDYICAYYGQAVQVPDTAIFTDAEWQLLKQVDLVKTRIVFGKPREYVYICADDVLKALANGVKFTGTAPTNAEGKKVDPKDAQFNGLIFTCKNFFVNTAGKNFKLVGGLVAYGGDPTNGSTFSGEGKITINARTAEFTYDTKYLSIFQGLTSKKIEKLYWASY